MQNYYFSYMNFALNNNNNNYNYFDNFIVFDELYILYILIILTIISSYIQINIETNIYNIVMGLVLTQNHQYTMYGVKINTYNIFENSALYFDYENIKNYNILGVSNYYKNIQNNCINDILKYGVSSFKNNIKNYDNFTIDIFSSQIKTFEYENEISFNTFYNIINSVILNYSSQNQTYTKKNSNNSNNLFIKSVFDNILTSLNKHLIIYKNIFGGTTNNDITINEFNITETNINNLYTNNNYYDNKQITIFTILFKQIENNNINNNSLVLLFYYNCYITFITMGCVNIYNINRIIYELANVINDKILNYENNYNFFKELNALLISQYNNNEYITAVTNFFNTYILNNIYILSDNVIKNLLTFNIKTNFTTNNAFNIIDDYIFNDISVSKNINNKINNWKLLLGLAVDYNDSEIIKIVKSINNVYSDIPIQEKIINYISTLNNNKIINKYGIIKLINSITLLFDDEVISKYCDYNYKIFMDNFQNINKLKGFREMIGDSDNNNIITGIKPYIKKFIKKTYILPIKFYFENVNNAIPLISCMYSNININVKLNTNIFINSYNINNLTKIKINTQLNMDYILLEREERIMMTKNKIDNLIERYKLYELIKEINLETFKNTTINFDFELDNSVKGLVWEFYIIIDNYNIKLKREFVNKIEIINYLNPNNSNIPDGLIINTKFLLNGCRRDGINTLSTNTSYNKLTTILNPYKYNTKVQYNNKYNTYSFAINPKIFQPSGSFNMSLINKFTIQIELDNNQISKYINTLGKIFDLNKLYIKIILSTCEYNIVRYQSGLAGLLFNK